MGREEKEQQQQMFVKAFPNSLLIQVSESLEMLHLDFHALFLPASFVRIRLVHQLQATHRGCHCRVCRTILNGSRKMHPDPPQETLPAGFLSTLCTVFTKRHLPGTCWYIIRKHQYGRKPKSPSPCPMLQAGLHAWFHDLL